MFTRLALIPTPPPAAFVASFSYEAYATMLGGLSRSHTASRTFEAGIFTDLKDLGLTGALVSLFQQFKTYLTDLADKLKIGLKDLVLAFQQRDVFAILKAVSFNLHTLLTFVHDVQSLIKSGLFNVLEDLAKSPLIKGLEQHTVKIDDVLNQYPLLKKCLGPAMAGLLFYMWINSSFTGNLGADLDFTAILQALRGAYNITEFLTSPDGLAMIVLFAAGFTGVSFVWLASDLSNILLALAYTGMKKAGKTPAAQKVLQHFIPTQHVA